MNYESLSVLGFSFGVVLIAALILFRRRDEVSVSFTIFCVFVVGWGVLCGFWITQNYPEEVTLKMMRGSNFFSVFIPPAWLHFIYKFLNKKEPIKYFFLTQYVLAIIFALSTPFDFYIQGVRPILHYQYFIDPTPWFGCATAIFFLTVPIGFFELIRAYLDNSGLRKKQIKYVICGTAIGFMGGGNIFLPIHGVEVGLFFFPTMMLYPFFVGIALIRFDLFRPEEIVEILQKERLALMGVISASINHEVKNPLYVIRGLAESCLGEGENKQQDMGVRLAEHERVFNKCISQVDRAMHIVKKFSALTKTQNENLEKVECIGVEEIIEQVFFLVQYELKSQKTEFKKTIEEGLKIKGIQSDFEEIFLNLFMNSCAALKGISGGVLKVSACSKGDQVEIVIEDNGPGIKEELLDKVFEPLYTTKEEGTGLGLYIVKTLVERNGGNISITSEVGKGIIVGLTFPVGGNL